ncbi:MAG TPA: NADPH-dependent FMN reductase [Ideonella sp.]|nr:NADPH-dependent FMN reductase [Ideonella sp.]
MKIVGISGSPTRPSRSTALLRAAMRAVSGGAAHTVEIQVRDLPAQALLHADTQNAVISLAIAQVAQADLVLVATPIYKAAYSGVLKSFLDLLPQDALRGKTVLPLAVGGSPGHLLALDYALKPLLSALGARHALDAVYATDSQFVADEVLGYRVDAAVTERLERSLQVLADMLAPKPRLADAPTPDLPTEPPAPRADNVLARAALVLSRSATPQAAASC